ncbi:MAG TPA: HEAT repeat domain-containing protein [bacterium]|nr:HEAT repeat domain-containing protein [bacterium]HPJ72103.1 HEAT repeat domain-containing protein [bacterium]HPQ65450.1 HEAT repeat domain-containing protein [bacterium]
MNLAILALAALWGAHASGLDSPTPADRSAACLAAAERGPAAVDELIPLLDDESMLVRHSSAFALARIGGERVESLFTRGLSSKNAEMRRMSALGLGMMGKMDSFEAVEPLMGDPDWEVRWAAAYALGRSRDRRALPELRRSAAADPYYDPDREVYPVREAAAESVRLLEGSIGWRTDPSGARRRASAGGKLLVLYFRQGGGGCPSYEAEMFGDEKIIDALQRTVPVWLDYSRAPAEFERYRVRQVPALICLDSRGRVLSRGEGTLSKPEFLDRLLKGLDGGMNSSELRRRLSTDPGDLEAAWILTGRYLEEEAWSPAWELAGVILAADPDNVSGLLDNALFTRAYILGKTGKYSEAADRFRALSARFPRFGERSEALYCWGLSALKAGKTEEGKRALELVTREYRGSAPAAAAHAILSGKTAFGKD